MKIKKSLLLFFFLTVGIYKISFGCDCVSSIGFAEAKVVFKGKVTRIQELKKPHIEYLITFKVDSVYKGIIHKKMISIITPCLVDACCGIPFKVNEIYKVFAYVDEKRLYTDLCTETSKIIIER